MWGWADVGLWVAVCFLAKISFHRPTCKTTFARLTQSQAISQSFRVFISFRSMRDTSFFCFSNSFLYKITVSFTMVIKRSPGGQACRWRAVNFEIHLWSSGMNADCIWRSISIQHVQIEAGLNSDPGNDSFWVEIRDAKHIDWSTAQRFTHPLWNVFKKTAVAYGADLLAFELNGEVVSGLPGHHSLENLVLSWATRVVGDDCLEIHVLLMFF